ncbi:putative transmembrane protein [Toxoplasma gondii GAB2-2007-GAL-DOM2]|uniref:Transmembrane protein n=5 Tax=Toxoplasma gondii TaxID=5811 RepID=S7W6M7_TOXGG|nr:hypothetical protein TGGT1_240255 [Toxoplasma gondii GT1]KAF4643424.1 hypothetical protein TGRH88_030900 [Toxoplasma gondii]KFG39523.1 putative transmembrane protein [Toxoplasma gondii GAB2-2007-GAL-DOM2]KFG48514.1 putative transmembrane protein [Toxoplasma gondii FOU]RQX70809.1 putative transmembrane protein [Toxoplasma gondii CAST]
MRWWRSFSGRAQREVFLRGSPAYKWGVWIVGLGGGLLWIWESEKNAPISERRVFLPARREVKMTSAEIKKWNEKYSGGAALLTPPAQADSCANGDVLPAGSCGRTADRTGERSWSFSTRKSIPPRSVCSRNDWLNESWKAFQDPILFSSLHEALRQREVEVRERERRREEALRLRREKEVEEERRARGVVAVDEAREKLKDQLRKETGQEGDGRRPRRLPYFSSLG